MSCWYWLIYYLQVCYEISSLFTINICFHPHHNFVFTRQRNISEEKVPKTTRWRIGQFYELRWTKAQNSGAKIRITAGWVSLCATSNFRNFLLNPNWLFIFNILQCTDKISLQTIPDNRQRTLKWRQPTLAQALASRVRLMKIPMITVMLPILHYVS